MSKPVSDDTLLNRYEPVTESGCWLWSGQIAPNGYGRMNATRIKTMYPHRFFYEKYKGSIPDGLTIDHLCRVRCCVNPDHLEAVTQRVNNLRSNNMAARHALTTHCPNGHEYTVKNTYRLKQNGGVIRKCKQCHAEIVRRCKQNKGGVL